MATPKLSLLTFPQKFEAGKLYVNILIIPRNINPLLALEPGFSAFADATAKFKCMIINSLDGLPLTTNVTDEKSAALVNQIASSRKVWEALKLQLQATDGLTIDDAESAKNENRAQSSIDTYKGKSIKKYLPETYRNAFNFTKSRTRYAVTGDEYQCSVKNASYVDTKTNRDKISWGKAIGLCLRNPLLAVKAGLIYHATIDVPANTFDEGGWLYIDFDAGSSYETLNKDLVKQYAAQIPSLKNVTERQLFAAVQFPVSTVALSGAGYDEIIREAIIYDDGFAKIVHANQPVNDYLLEEQDKSNPPQKDIGIRLGWDDEQLTIWNNRQMLQKEETTDSDVDSPLGVFSYCIDAQKEGDAKWFAQNRIVAPDGIIIQQDNIQVAAPGRIVELGTEVHAASHGNSATDGFWLPMYFTNWMGKSLAIPDKDAEEINQLTADKVKPANSVFPNNTINTIPKKTFHPYLQDPEQVLALIYGTTYNFRVRLMDLTGGRPGLKTKPLHAAEKPVYTLHFKRHTGAGPLVVMNIQDTLNKFPKPTKTNRLPDTSILENIVDHNNPALTVERPKLGYPAVVFTNKYLDPIAELKKVLETLPANPQQVPVNIGLPDSDINSFKVRIEIKSLEMDNALSLTGKDPYVILYEKIFSFDKNDFNAAATIKIIYKDFHELPFDGSFADAGNVDELILPRARHLHLTFIPIVDNADNNYADDSIEFGKTVILSSFKNSNDETKLLSAIDEGVKAMYLQPETDGHVAPAILFQQKQIVTSSTPVELSRIADALNITATNLTLQGIKGERIQFGCSKLMRHSLAPDSSSVTFSSLAEIFNHWVIAVNYSLNRDWSWDALDVESFSVYRKWRFESQALFGAEELIGTINVSGTANINALTDAQRDRSNLIFLDAFDPKKVNNDFPEEVFLSYRIEPKFKLLFGKTNSPIDPVEVHLPVTIIPHQVPKLISAGIALSPYAADEKYTSTTIRQKFLWLEMEESPNDPNDTYYVRVLANAPDPLLCEIDESILFNVPEDPPLNINPEYIRIIIPAMNNDFAGIGAMQEMIAEQTADPRFYMVPLPSGLHAASDELFGFFSYELRVGHKKELWSTAQARYGRPLKVNGVQHPAPTLVCNAFRRKYVLNPYLSPINEIAITAPFANAVLNGKNVAALPPQTSLWCFLYVQAKQADGKAYRNILLNSRIMQYHPNKQQEEEGNRYGITSFKQDELSNMLENIGLPVNSSLSVLCVEMFPLHNTWRLPVYSRKSEVFGEEANFDAPADVAASYQDFNPLTDGLGKYRIYRTSALVAVENICCVDC